MDERGGGGGVEGWWRVGGGGGVRLSSRAPDKLAPVGHLCRLWASLFEQRDRCKSPPAIFTLHSLRHSPEGK